MLLSHNKYTKQCDVIYCNGRKITTLVIIVKLSKLE